VADILYVITDLHVGGVPLHLFRLVLAMRERGHRVAVASLAAPGPVGEMLETRGVTVEYCGGRGGWDVRVLPRLTSVLRRRQPQIVHSLLFHANLASRLTAPRVGISRSHVICELQTVEVERVWQLRVDRLTWKWCRWVVGNSPSVVTHLARQARIPSSHLRLVRGGIDPAGADGVRPIDRAQIGLGGGERMVLWVGRLDPVKGLEHLLGAFRALPADHRAHLVLAGGGPLHKKLVRIMRSSSLTRRVELLGPRNDVPALLAAADLFVFPSRTEGLPNALLEAMAARCPIVTTDVPGCRDLIVDGRNGLLVPYGDVPALTAAMDRLLTDREEARRLGEAARATVEREWHIDATYDAYEALYDEITAEMRKRLHIE
jgi:glycosyltransferase involved in cell wall biosynthesis